MYRYLVRPILFLFPPEGVHRFVAACLRLIFSIPGLAVLIRKFYCIHHPSLERELFGIRFPNPVGIAAGFDKEARLYNQLAEFGFGHIETGTVTPLAQPGNPKPRLFRIPKDHALINRMGFNNHGVQEFAKNLIQNRPKTIIGGNIGKNTLTPNEQALDDYCNCFLALYDLVDYFVVNVSCPNIAGLSVLQDQDALTRILKAVQSLNHSKPKPKPVLLKISPDLDEAQLEEIIEVVQATRISGIIATNTTTARSGLTTPSDRIAKIGQGGLSGSPLKESSTRAIAYLHKQSKGRIPIIASGGIFTAEDAIEKIRAGASLVQVYTGFIYEGPSIARKINKGLIKYVDTKQRPSPQERKNLM